MEKYVIRGGKPLVGDVNIGGAKNAAVAILPATILAGGKCLIENLPCISDVMASLQILSDLGAFPAVDKKIAACTPGHHGCEPAVRKRHHSACSK